MSESIQKTSMDPIYMLKFRRGGLFYLVNNIIDFLHIAERNNFQFDLKLEDSLYQEDSRSGPVWNYYFEDIFDIDRSKTYPIYKYKIFRKNHLTAPRVKDGCMVPLLLPRNRELANSYIKKHIRLQPHIQEIINRCKEDFSIQQTIGLHIRGPGRLHGGMKEILKKLRVKNSVPFHIYFEHVDKYLNNCSDVKIFLCSDSQMVIREFINKYGDRIITYDSSRRDYGEMHELGPENNELEFSYYKLGEDVLVETYLLAETEFLIHGNSNVSNFVLCLNPDLEHKYVFEEIETKIDWDAVHLNIEAENQKRRLRRKNRNQTVIASLIWGKVISKFYRFIRGVIRQI